MHRFSLSLAAVVSTCLGARTGLDTMRRDSVLAQPPPSLASSCFPQVPQRLPQAAAEATWVTITPLYGDRPSPRLTGVRSQEDSLERGHSVPRSGAITWPPRLPMSDLLPLHGPPLTVTPLCRLSPEMPRAASERVKMPPLPAAPEASGRRPQARSSGPMAKRYRELVPPSPWGTMAADMSQEAPSSDGKGKRLWQGPVARQGKAISCHPCDVRVARRSSQRPRLLGSTWGTPRWRNPLRCRKSTVAKHQDVSLESLPRASVKTHP